MQKCKSNINSIHDSAALIFYFNSTCSWVALGDSVIYTIKSQVVLWLLLLLLLLMMEIGSSSLRGRLGMIALMMLLLLIHHLMSLCHILLKQGHVDILLVLIDELLLMRRRIISFIVRLTGHHLLKVLCWHLAWLSQTMTTLSMIHCSEISLSLRLITGAIIVIGHLCRDSCLIIG